MIAVPLLIDSLFLLLLLALALSGYRKGFVLELFSLSFAFTAVYLASISLPPAISFLRDRLEWFFLQDPRFLLILKIVLLYSFYILGSWISRQYLLPFLNLKLKQGYKALNQWAGYALRLIKLLALTSIVMLFALPLVVTPSTQKVLSQSYSVNLGERASRYYIKLFPKLRQVSGRENFYFPIPPLLPRKEA